MSNQHQNFRGSFHSRTLMVKRVSEEGVSVREVVANQFGVSRRTVHNWLVRYERGGPAALYDRGSHPQKSACGLPAQEGGQPSGATAEATELFADMLVLFPAPSPASHWRAKALGFEQALP